MRHLKDRSPHLSRWSKIELIDSLSRDPAILSPCGLIRLDLREELNKRAERRSARIASREKNLIGLRERVTRERTKWHGYTVKDWKVQLPALVSNTARLRGSMFQSCWVSVDHALRYMRIGVKLRKQPNLYAVPFLAFWQFCLPLGMFTADDRLDELRERVYQRRKAVIASGF